MATVSNPDALTKLQLHTGQTVVVPSHQANEHYTKGTETFKILPSVTSTPSFGNFIDLFIQPSDISVLSRAYLNMNVSALSMTGTSSNVRFTNDATFWIAHQDNYLSGQILETIYPESTYLRDLLTNPTETKDLIYRSRINTSKAINVTQAASSQNVLIPLKGFWDSIGVGFEMFSLAAPLQIRVYLQALTAITTYDGTGGSLPVCTINSASLYVLGRDLTGNQALINNKLQAQKQMGLQRMYYSPIQQNKQVLTSGSTTYNILLSSMVGNFSHFFVVIRLATSVNTSLANTWDGTSFLQCSQLSIINSNGSILGGVAYPDLWDRCNVVPHYFPGVDITDLQNGLAGTNTPFYMYCLPFSANPKGAMEKGVQTGTVALSGQHQLQLTFATALTSSYVVDVVGYCKKLVNVNGSGVGSLITL